MVRKKYHEVFYGRPLYRGPMKKAEQAFASSHRALGLAMTDKIKRFRTKEQAKSFQRKKRAEGYLASRFKESNRVI